MIVPKLQGRRSIVLRRCSTVGQVERSIGNQTVDIERLISANNVTVVKTFELEGVTGSVPGARTDIDEIIALKRSGVDFDLLICSNSDRFTRSGQGHGGNLLWDLEGEGITVYFAAEGLFSDDRLQRMMLGFLFDAAQQTAISISRSATLGVTNRYLEGRLPHSRAPIYGLDRMYYTGDRDLHIIRALPDGTQHMIDPTTGDVLRSFGQNPTKGTPVHYIKQKNEDVRLIPGDPARVAVVHLIFELVYVERRSFHSIAKQLNDANIPSPRGLEWEGDAVKSISINPTYVGLLRRGVTTQAIYFKAARGSPAPSEVVAKELRERKKPRLRRRPGEEWLMREDPILRDFLPAHVFQLARPAIEARKP